MNNLNSPVILNPAPDSEYVRFFSIAGISIRVESELPITKDTFHEKFSKFIVSAPGEDLITLCHDFSLLPPVIDDSWQLVYRKIPWAIYKKGKTWIYLGIWEDSPDIWTMGIFNGSHTEGYIHHHDSSQYLRGNNASLTLFPSDQILLARVLADRQACYLHAAGMILYDYGILFVGHSEAGKSTTVTMLRNEGEILCDDRIIVRRWPEGFKIHGTWSHGDVPEVSNSSAPLRAIFFLEKSRENYIEPIEDRSRVVRMLPLYVIKPLVTADWWEKTLDLIGDLSREVPVYRLKLDTSGKVKDILKEFLCPESEMIHAHRE